MNYFRNKLNIKGRPCKFEEEIKFLVMVMELQVPPITFTPLPSLTSILVGGACDNFDEGNEDFYIKKKDLESVVFEFKICVKVQAFGNNDGRTTLNYYCCYHVDAF